MAEKISTEGLKSAADTTKQIITLSTGVVTLTITFLEKIIQTTASSDGTRTVPWSMFVAWIFFGLAILAAMATLGAITGTLEAVDRKQRGDLLEEPDKQAAQALSRGANIKYPALAMSISFIIAMTLTILTGFFLLR